MEAQGRQDIESQRGSASASFQADVAIVRLRGECDLSMRPQIRQVIDAARDTPGVIVDLSDCTFLDSTALLLLFSARREVAARGGRLELVIPASPGAVDRIVNLMRVRDVFSTHSSVDEARSALEA